MANGAEEALSFFSRSAFRQHERSRSIPSLPSVPLPVITSSPPSSSTSIDRIGDRPPTPHRGYSLAVPAAVPPGRSGSRGRNRAYSSGSTAATRGSGRGEIREKDYERGGEEEKERIQERDYGLRDVRSRETMRSRRTRGPSPAPTAASAAPVDFYDSVQIYAIVAGRRANFDLLLWSVPSTSFAAHTFLFQTALAGDSSRTARIVSMGLSVLITTLQLFTRQLQAEAADHAWLEDWEKRHGVDPADCAHGETWASYRAVLPHRARHFKFLASIRGFTLWSNGMLIIGLVALGVLTTAAVDGTAFQNCQDN